MDFLSLFDLKFQLQKIDDQKTLFKIEAMSPLGGATKQSLQRNMDNFVKDLSAALMGEMIITEKPVSFNTENPFQTRVWVTITIFAILGYFIWKYIIK